MTISEVKEYLYKTVSSYYGKEHVFYAGTKKPKPLEPYITLKIYGYRKNRSKITVFDVEKQCNKDYWQAKVMLDINLYTVGINISPEGKVPAYEDTSEEDLAGFIMYLESDFMEDDLARHNVSIELDGEIKNLSALVGEGSAFRYRAMAGLKVNFTDCSYGKYGQNGIRQHPGAGGGGLEAFPEDSDAIESANIKGEIPKEG